MYAHKLPIFAPFGQSGNDFIENHYAWYDRLAWKMPSQAWMIDGNRAANLKAHWSRASMAIIFF